MGDHVPHAEDLMYAKCNMGAWAMPTADKQHGRPTWSANIDLLASVFEIVSHDFDLALCWTAALCWMK